MALSTLATTSSETGTFRLVTRLTVEIETPARLATSAIVGRLGFRVIQLYARESGSASAFIRYGIWPAQSS
jgi:hypothetical protein